ncbi:PhoX family protein [Gilvimarinus polysaccharolyticus]|uniref:PhoX family protein n=1 Tax=Gilvimarinus polysaccharolyticus TaxID=863921 RepID=UPI000A04F845|nr:PhoX family phosphatase [Gilvimarinus polysaccharolyticus]
MSKRYTFNNSNSLQSDLTAHGVNDIDDIAVNPAGNPSLWELSCSRRTLATGSMMLCLASFAGPFSLSGCVTKPVKTTFKDALRAKISFTPVGAALGENVDVVTVPDGYTASAFFSWGDEVVKGAPVWQKNASNNAAEQQLQAGQNNDGMHYFPLSDAPNEHGLLVVNHEYTNDTLHPEGPCVVSASDGRKLRPIDQVAKEQAAHGVSVIEIERRAGQWQRVAASPYNRRLTANTAMDISGPAAGSDAMKTAQDPTGTRVLGTLNNCSMGVTPWGTYLICEENWKNYFVNRDQSDWQHRPSQQRYGVATGAHSHKYFWESADERFDATFNPDLPHGGFVNEPNRFGWVVEFDPFDPTAVPIKRTALGRLVREGCTCVQADDGSLAFYSGDDTRGEYVYKFVPDGKFDPDNLAANRRLLDSGTVYCAVYHADGRGEWRPLIYGQHGLTPERGFYSQADVLINLRGAADLVGATPMDRPEWVAVHPQSADGYVSLTNNHLRGVAFGSPLDAANPRAENHHGQILRWREHNQHPAALTFEWELFLLAGPTLSAPDSSGALAPLTGDRFSCPDGLWFDGDGRLWIATDYDEREAPYLTQGMNQLLCADPVTREVRRFMTGPAGSEITGLTGTPDGTTLWFNVQHPGLSYPASDGKTRPRSTTVVVTKNDGGVIGT